MTDAERIVWAAAFVANVLRDDDVGFSLVSAKRVVCSLREAHTAKSKYINKSEFKLAQQMLREFKKE